MKELTSIDLGKITGLSSRQIMRYAGVGKIPECRKIEGVGRGSGYRFSRTPTLIKWLTENTVRKNVRNKAGRKLPSDFESLTKAIEDPANMSRYHQNVDDIIKLLTKASNQLPKTIRRVEILRRDPRELLNELRALNFQLEPILQLHTHISDKAVIIAGMTKNSWKNE